MTEIMLFDLFNININDNFNYFLLMNNIDNISKI